MRCTVTWDPQVEEELARAWTIARNRQAITDAANWIDDELAVDPHAKGEAFYGDRILVREPLAVTFSIHPDDCLVRVLQVWFQAES